MTHDKKRHGTTNLFAALDVASGEVECMPRHPRQEFLRLLKIVQKRAGLDLGLHFILENYAIHKHPKVKAWPENPPESPSSFLPPPPRG